MYAWKDEVVVKHGEGVLSVSRAAVALAEDSRSRPHLDIKRPALCLMHGIDIQNASCSPEWWHCRLRQAH